MPKNTKGGKKFKKMKHNLDEQRVLDLPDKYQEFALVNKLLGNSRVTVTYIKDNQSAINAMGVISGKLRKRKQWVIAGNFVIISERDFEKDKVDVIHVYKEYEMNELKRRGLINKKLVNLSNSIGTTASKGEDNGDHEFSEFVETEPVSDVDPRKKQENKFRGANITVQDFGIISDDDED